MIASAIAIVAGMVVMGAFAYVLLNPDLVKSFDINSLIPVFEFPREILPQPEVVDISSSKLSIPAESVQVQSLGISGSEMYTHYESRFTVQNTGAGSIKVDAVSYGIDNELSNVGLILGSGQKHVVSMSNLKGVPGESYLLRVNGTAVSSGTSVLAEKIILLREPTSTLEIIDSHVERTTGQLPTLKLTLRNSGMTTITLSDIILTKRVDQSLWDPNSSGIVLKPGAQKTLDIRLDSNEYIMTRVATSQRSVTFSMLPELELQVSGDSDIGQTITESAIIPVASSKTEQVSQLGSDATYLSLDQYRDYLLTLINKDRADWGLGPVKLSDNKATQSHAFDMLEARKMSHWTTDGMKPYMRYSLYDGTDAVFQNVAMWDYLPSAISKCESGEYQCAPIDVKKALERLEYLMMYEDYECCKDGHKHNILDPNRTHVSIGIAYDKYGVYIVQNFENNYTSLDKPKVDANGTVSLSGKLLSNGEDLSYDYIMVFYDEMPTRQTYAANADRNSYDLGQFVGGVIPPSGGGCNSSDGSSLMQLVAGSVGLPSCKVISSTGQAFVQASEWSVDGNDISITLSIAEFVGDEGSGVYTIYLMASPKDDKGAAHFMVTSYSIFVK